MARTISKQFQSITSRKEHKFTEATSSGEAQKAKTKKPELIIQVHNAESQYWMGMR